MDHVMALAGGGKLTKGNTVTSRMECNQKKKLETRVEVVLRKLNVP